MEEQLLPTNFHKKEKKFLTLIKVVSREDAERLQKINVKEQQLINVKERTKSMGQREVGGYWKPEERRKISTLWQKSSKGSKRKYPKCVPLAKATRMTSGQKASAVSRKRAAGNPGGKPKM